LISSPPDATAVGADLDLDLFGILVAAGDPCLAAMGADSLVLGQFEDFLHDGKMTVVPPRRAGPIGALASFPGDGGGGLVFALELIGAVPRPLLALATEELTSKLLNFAAELIVLGLEFLAPLNGLGVPLFPVARLLT
jgi:hypothetical protein